MLNAMLLLASADTVVQAVTVVVILICLGILAWIRTHPVPQRHRDEALENYRRVVEQDREKRAPGD
jgi:hypothetical protein